MDGGKVVARDPRVGAILTHPDIYFAAARRRAWPRARVDIEAELDRRARARRDGARGLFRVLQGQRPADH